MVRSTLSIGLTIMNNYFCFVFDSLNRSDVCFIFYGDNSLLSSSIACRLLNCTSYYKNVSWTSMRQTSSHNTHILCEFWFCLRSFSQFVWLNMLLLPLVRHLDKGINVNDSAPLWNSSITLPTLRASLFPCGTRAVRKKTQKTVTIDFYREWPQTRKALGVSALTIECEICCVLLISNHFPY